MSRSACQLAGRQRFEPAAIDDAHAALSERLFDPDPGIVADAQHRAPSDPRRATEQGNPTHGAKPSGILDDALALRTEHAGGSSSGGDGPGNEHNRSGVMPHDNGGEFWVGPSGGLMPVGCPTFRTCGKFRDWARS